MLNEIFFIIIILLIAFLIGYLTAWLIYKGKKSNSSEEKDNNIDTIKFLNNKISQKEEKINELKSEVKELEIKYEDSKNMTVQPLVSEVNTDSSELEKELEEAKEKLADFELKLTESENNASIKLEELKKELEDCKSKQKASKTNKFDYKPLTLKEIADMEAKAAADPNFPKEKLNIAVVNADYASDKDDLKLIKGVGPFIEFKMNALGIQNFQQVMNFTEEDIDKVTDAITFFPGRIKRDDWVGQAKKLYEEKNSL